MAGLTSLNLLFVFPMKEGVVAVFVSSLYIQLHMQSVPVTTKIVSSNPAHGEVYLIQPNVIKFVSDLQQVGAFLRILRLPPPINLPPRYN